MTTLELLPLLIKSLSNLSLLEGLAMGVVTPEIAQKLMDAISAEREQYNVAIQRVIDETLAAAKAQAEAEGQTDVSNLVDTAISELSQIVPDEPVNSNPDEPSPTPVDEAATELMEEVTE